MRLLDRVCYDLQAYSPEQRKMFVSKLREHVSVWEVPDEFLLSYGIFIYRLNTGESFSSLVVDNKEEYNGYLRSFVSIHVPLADPTEIMPLGNIDLGRIR